MNFEPAEKMKNFEAGIFQILDEKKGKNCKNRERRFTTFL